MRKGGILHRGQIVKEYFHKYNLYIRIPLESFHILVKREYRSPDFHKHRLLCISHARTPHIEVNGENRISHESGKYHSAIQILTRFSSGVE